MKKFYSLCIGVFALVSNAFAQSPSITFVDLGLPSGTLWGDMNIGASSPEDPGQYLSWGEVEEKADYGWATYRWCDGTQKFMTKYVVNEAYGNVDNKVFLDDADDAAKVAGMGQMPTAAQLKELVETAKWTAETINGRKGARVSGSNGNSIFIPAAGFKTGTRLSTDNSAACLWTNELYVEQPQYYYNAHTVRMGFDRSGNVSLSAGDRNGMGYAPRNYGYSVRPVTAGSQSAIETVEISDEDAPVEYFNLQGIRVDNPSAGLYIRRQGSNVSKVLVR